jgi:hypothetical protein
MRVPAIGGLLDNAVALHGRERASLGVGIYYSGGCARLCVMPPIRAEWMTIARNYRCHYIYRLPWSSMPVPVGVGCALKLVSSAIPEGTTMRRGRPHTALLVWSVTWAPLFPGLTALLLSNALAPVMRRGARRGSELFGRSSQFSRLLRLLWHSLYTRASERRTST